MINIIKKLIPKAFLNFYHFILAKAGNFWYGQPSKKMIVIGVTGTNGKTTTVGLIAEILKKANYKAGYISTAEINTGGKSFLNPLKMTMPGRFILQKFLRQMADDKCTHAVIETSSQGIEQYRHAGIFYDILVFTNLTPEHIEAHGSFENYKKAKGKLFAFLKTLPEKNIFGKKIPKTLIINLDDGAASYFLQFEAEKKYGYCLKAAYDISGVEEIKAENLDLNRSGSGFDVKNTRFSTNLLGEHNIYNCLAAISTGLSLEVPLKVLAQSLNNVFLPGRQEFIEEGQNFKVIIDYAPEPEGVKKLYETLKMIEKEKIIHVLGSCGGGRDKARRPVLGKISGEKADYVIVTNEDPYDEDPKEIINQVANGAVGAGKILNQNLFTMLDRREAIRKAFLLARKNDIVIITGKGCEQAIVIKNNKKIPWDDRAIAREEIKRLKELPART